MRFRISARLWCFHAKAVARGAPVHRWRIGGERYSLGRGYTATSPKLSTRDQGEDCVASIPNRSGPLRVHLSAYVPGAGGGGWLSIDTNTVTWEWSRFGLARNRRLPAGVVAVQFPVAVLKVRFLPPLLNSGLILRGKDDGSFLVATFWGQHRRVVTALAASGIPMVQVRTNFTFGPEVARRYTWPAD